MVPLFESFLIWGFPIVASVLAAIHAWRPSRYTRAAFVLLFFVMITWQLVDGQYGRYSSWLDAVVFIALPLGLLLALSHWKFFRSVPPLLVVAGPAMYWIAFFGSVALLANAGIIE